MREREGGTLSVLLIYIFFVVVVVVVVIVGLKYSRRLESLVIFFRTLFETLIFGDLLTKYFGVWRNVKPHCCVPVTVLFWWRFTLNLEAGQGVKLVLETESELWEAGIGTF